MVGGGSRKGGHLQIDRVKVQEKRKRGKEKECRKYAKNTRRKRKK